MPTGVIILKHDKLALEEERYEASRANYWMVMIIILVVDNLRIVPRIRRATRLLFRQRTA